MIRPKRILFWATFAFAAYHMFGYAKTHTSDDVLTYKQFAKALIEDEDYIVRRSTQGDYAQRVLDTQSKRDELIGSNVVIFTYFVVNHHGYDEVEGRSYIQAEQVCRVNSPGVTSIIGESEVRIRHDVELVKDRNEWKVVRFNDPAMRAGI